MKKKSKIGYTIKDHSLELYTGPEADVSMFDLFYQPELALRASPLHYFLDMGDNTLNADVTGIDGVWIMPLNQYLN